MSGQIIDITGAPRHKVPPGTTTVPSYPRTSLLQKEAHLIGRGAQARRRSGARLIKNSFWILNTQSSQPNPFQNK